MLARKCDRCGKFFIPTTKEKFNKPGYTILEVHVCDVRAHPFKIGNTFDLCDSCADGLHNSWKVRINSMVRLNIKVDRNDEVAMRVFDKLNIEHTCHLPGDVGIPLYKANNIIYQFKEEEITYENAEKALDFLIAYMAITKLCVEVEKRNALKAPARKMTMEEIEEAIGCRIEIVEEKEN